MKKWRKKIPSLQTARGWFRRIAHVVNKLLKLFLVKKCWTAERTECSQLLIFRHDCTLLPRSWLLCLAGASDWAGSWGARSWWSVCCRRMLGECPSASCKRVGGARPAPPQKTQRKHWWNGTAATMDTRHVRTSLLLTTSFSWKTSLSSRRLSWLFGTEA